jgi:hypothetical protein
VSRKGTALGDKLAEEGFAPEFRSEDRPPVARYLLKASPGFELEFIAPLEGPELGRDGTPKATADVLGVSAQRLRNVELLLMEPAEVSVPELREGATLRVANPASFIFQRLLTLPTRRSLAKKAKDAVYTHDVLQLFTSASRLHPDVVAQGRRVSERLTRKQGGRIQETAAMLGDARSDVVREAARIMAESARPEPPSANAVAVACRLGLQDLLA